MPFNDTSKNVMADSLDESAVQVTHVGVHTLVDPGTAVNALAGEAAGGTPAYVRIPVVWGASAAGLKLNTSVGAIDVPAGTYGFLTLWNAATGNVSNYRGHIPFGGVNPLKGFFTVDTNLAADTLLSRAHGMANTDRVQVFNVFAEALPTGLTEGVIYFVVGATADTYQVSLTSGGAAVDITAVGGGEGYWQRLVPEVFGSQGQVTIAASALVLDVTAM